MPLSGILLSIYAFAGCLYWFWLAVGSLRTALRVPRLSAAGDPAPRRWPKVSIVVAARHEAATIEAALRTLLSTDYPDLQIIVVDDRSTDATGEIIDRLAAAEPRLEPVHVAELPGGWLGKVHALHQGVARADGDWLLFTDADVHLRPDALRRAVAHAEERGLDHFALMPDLIARSFPVAVVATAFLRTFSTFMRIWAVDDPRSKAFIGVGAFNLVRRAAFERTAGFEWLRLEVADDVGLGLMMKSSGFRSGTALGTDLVSVEWYPTLRDLARGTEKGYASVAGCRPGRMWALGAIQTALELAPLAMFLPVGHRGFWLAGLAMVAAAAVNIAATRSTFRARLLPLACFPLAGVIGLILFLRAGWLGWRRGGVLWRDTFYPSEILQAGARVKFP